MTDAGTETGNGGGRDCRGVRAEAEGEGEGEGEGEAEGEGEGEAEGQVEGLDRRRWCLFWLERGLAVADSRLPCLLSKIAV